MVGIARLLDVCRRRSVFGVEMRMILTEVRQFSLAEGPKQLEQFPRRYFVICRARKSIRRRKNRGDQAVATREQAATFDVRLTTRVRQHFLQNFFAHSDRIGHAIECTSASMAESG